MVPFQFVIIKSSPSARPYEHASPRTSVNMYMITRKLSLPAPKPFSPFSSSSSRRKFRGTLADMIAEERKSEAVEGKGVGRVEVVRKSKQIVVNGGAA